MTIVPSAAPQSRLRSAVRTTAFAVAGGTAGFADAASARVSGSKIDTPLACHASGPGQGRRPVARVVGGPTRPPAQVSSISHDIDPREESNEIGESRSRVRSDRSATQVRSGARAQEPATHPADQIERLAELREQGILTEEEFAAEQKKLLGD